MSMELLSFDETAEGLVVTFVTEHGLEQLEGSCEEIARLATVMQQVSVIAGLNDTESVWVEDVKVGSDIVKLGLSPGGEARVRIIRR
jgi:hypothetical protein